MNHGDWIRKEFRKLSQSLGFRYIPDKEIQNRLNRVRDGMKKQEIEALLVVQKMDFYYLSGTTQDGVLFLPLEGNPLLMIKRELERAKVESPLEDVVLLKSIRDVPSLIRKHWRKLPQNLGLEFDLLP
ncbi:MAG: aminopeptidase P family N-terminal domain-containing protein, partial [Deltaproteobacteria bacterium]|nr:aminopeptidase P family N-terminal domain-containing protein [Deltaproteobacteria bacterium]